MAFRSHLDGSPHLLTPERSIQVQMNLGADVIMAFDECPPWPAPREAVAEATDRTSETALRVYQLVLRDGGRYFMVQGLVGRDQEQPWVEEFRKVAASFKRTPAAAPAR